MGMYTDMKLDITLKSLEEIGPEVHTALLKLFHEGEYEDLDIDKVPRSDWPHHPFWTADRFDRLGGGGYGDVETDGPASYTHPVVRIRCSVKYGSETIMKFLDWITPYVESVDSEGSDFDDDGRSYDIDGRSYDISSANIVFMPNEHGVPRFAIVTHFENNGAGMGDYGYNTTPDPEVDWIETYVNPEPEPTPVATPQTMCLSLAASTRLLNGRS